MIGYREEVLHSWVQNAPSVRDLASLLSVSSPFGLRALIDRLRQPETVFADSAINTDDDAPINGYAKIQVSSNGTYVFSGIMRATGLFSYHYGVQAWLATGEGAVVAAERIGDVFGTDTPGPNKDPWSQPGSNAGIPLHWRSLRQGRALGFSMHAEIGGVLGTAHDILVFALEGIGASAVLGPAGWLVLIGSELGDMNIRIGSPDILAGIAVAGAVFLVVGPFGVVPAIVSGFATAELINIRHRGMKPEERAFADRVFMGKIDYNRVTLTNMSHDNGRKFTIPSLGDTILVNLDDALDNPMSYQEPGTDYPEPGSVFIHELTHAWQITNNSFLGVLCGMSGNYDYFDARGRMNDTAWPRRSWGSFNNEQQAHIVDDWYGAHVARDAAGMFVFDAQGIPVTDLNGFDALNDPAFHFIRDNIRTGLA
ncbi:MAG TPA: hypothetical protein VH639_01825 [Bryobacteraceae bacterium]|jgi:hypothetical protein